MRHSVVLYVMDAVFLKKLALARFQHGVKGEAKHKLGRPCPRAP